MVDLADSGRVINQIRLVEELHRWGQWLLWDESCWLHERRKTLASLLRRGRKGIWYRRRRLVQMARYRKVDTRIWGDTKFRDLSSPGPSAKYLWLFVLTGPHTSNVPGLFRA